MIRVLMIEEPDEERQVVWCREIEQHTEEQQVALVKRIKGAEET